jgi:hypothetical protein
MIHFPIEFTNSVLDSEERVVGTPDIAPAESSEPRPLPVPESRDEGPSSPVCAACWAY